MRDLTCNCQYCSTFTFLWEDNTGKVYLEIPKNGSWVIKVEYYNFIISMQHGKMQYNDKDSRIKPISPSKLSNYTRGMVVLRDPLQRFKSNFAYFFGNEGKRTREGCLWMLKNNLISKEHEYSALNNEEKLDLLIENWEKLNNFSIFHHFLSQTSFLNRGFLELDNIEVYGMKDIGSILNLDKKNTSNSTAIELTSSQESFIRTVYEEDYSNNLIKPYIAKNFAKKFP